MDKAPTILFVGDLVGGLGRRTFLALLPGLVAEHAPDFVVVNGENAAGVDVITLGNHTYQRKEIYPYLDSTERILRPANFLASQPGHGWCIVEKGGVRLAVVNLQGNVFLRSGRVAFPEIDSVLDQIGAKADHVLVDFHAEATSEKVALGWYLDGRVTAVVGTHTHVPTADSRVLPNGTAYISDVGMTGPRGGVIGVIKEQAIDSLRTQMNIRFETSEDDPWLMGVLVRCSAEPRRAEAIEQLLLPWR